MDPSNFRLAVTETQLGKQLGNAMSVNVLERLFSHILPAAGLVDPGLLRDRWADGSAVRKLSKSRDCLLSSTPTCTISASRCLKRKRPAVSQKERWTSINDRMHDEKSDRTDSSSMDSVPRVQKRRRD